MIVRLLRVSHCPQIFWNSFMYKSLILIDFFFNLFDVPGWLSSAEPVASAVIQEPQYHNCSDSAGEGTTCLRHQVTDKMIVHLCRSLSMISVCPFLFGYRQFRLSLSVCIYISLPVCRQLSLVRRLCILCLSIVQACVS